MNLKIVRNILYIFESFFLEISSLKCCFISFRSLTPHFRQCLYLEKFFFGVKKFSNIFRRNISLVEKPSSRTNDIPRVSSQLYIVQGFRFSAFIPILVPRIYPTSLSPDFTSNNNPELTFYILTFLILTILHLFSYISYFYPSYIICS